VKLRKFSDCDNPDAFRADFSTLPHRVRKDPFRVGLLAAPICERFLATPYPAPRDFWLCYNKNDRAVGGISANVSASRADTGYFGLFEVELESGCEQIASLLVSAACDWLAKQGVSRIVGPIAFNTWFPYRFRLDSDERCFDWEPVNPPEYVLAVEAAGFEIGEKYSSTAFSELEEVAGKLEPAYRRSLSEGFSYRAFAADSLDTHIPALYRISHAAFSDNYLFEPIAQELFAKAYVSIADKGRRMLSWFVLDPNGEPVGFLYTFIVRIVCDGTTETAVVLKSIAIMPDMRGKGLSNGLLYLVIKESLELGIDYAISATVHSGIQSESYARKGGQLWRHKYALWQKDIS